MKNVILPFVICTNYDDDNFVRIVSLIAKTGKDEITLTQPPPTPQFAIFKRTYVMVIFVNMLIQHAF